MLNAVQIQRLQEIAGRISELPHEKARLGYRGAVSKSAHHIIPSEIVEMLITEVRNVNLEAIRATFDQSWNGIVLPAYDTQMAEGGQRNRMDAAITAEFARLSPPPPIGMGMAIEEGE